MSWEAGYIITGISIVGIFVAVLGILLSWSQMRNSRYLTEIREVELDRTRALLEMQIERMTDQMFQDRGRWAELNHLVVDSIRKDKADEPWTIEKSLAAGSRKFMLDMGVPVDEIEVDHKLVFVLTPFATSHKSVFKIISEVGTSIGLTVRRGDETRIPGPILPHILTEISKAGLIVANINGRNANVFYELGIAQAIGKPVVIVSKKFDDVPFDLRQQRLVLYQTDEELFDGFKDALSRFLISENPNYVDKRLR